jgi:hypothetical protein
VKPSRPWVRGAHKWAELLSNLTGNIKIETYNLREKNISSSRLFCDL